MFPCLHQIMASVLILGVLIGGFVAWHWKLMHRAWEDWRQAVGRVKGQRALFWRHSWRGILFTVIAAIVLFVVLHL